MSQASPADVDRAVSAAREAFDRGPWPAMTAAERQAIVARFNELHAARGEEIAALVTAENGSPIWFTRWTQTALPEQTSAYLRAAQSFGWEERLNSSGAPGTVVRREPVGVVAAVIPWNAPHQSALVKIIPALLAGCTVILKASPETALDALLLGGKSASIILEDADLAAVMEGLKFASFANNAENCQAHTRILARRSRDDEVVAALKNMVEGLTVGDPSDPSTFIGPMVRADQQQRVQSYIELGIKEGARLVTGGSDVPPGLEGGFYVRPTVFVRRGRQLHAHRPRRDLRAGTRRHPL